MQLKHIVVCFEQCRYRLLSLENWAFTMYAGLFLLLLNLVRGGCAGFGYEYATNFFKQKVDHFSYLNGDYFSQRYLVADQYWDYNGGPIFFYTGNEGDITMFANNTGLMWELAPEFHALLVFAEHRYYGLSLPYGNNAYNFPRNIGYLTTEQALADFSTLIDHLKGTLPGASSSKVVAFGGSYGGMLAAWIRMKYPHMVIGAISSSAPVLWFSDLTPCEKFAEIVTNNFHQANPQCSASVRRSWKVIRYFGKTGAGTEWLTSNFNLCTNLTTEDIQQLINWLQSTWQYLAMTNYPYPTDFLMPLPAHPINEACKYLRNATEPDKILLFHIMKAASVFQNYTGSVKCYNISASSGERLGEDTWNYQACSEMVMPMCQNGVTDMFEPNPWSLKAFTEECVKNYKVKPDAQKAIIMYGGRNITAASNIIFSNGKLDPWSAGGVVSSVSDTVVAYLMENAAHHLDLRTSNPADPESVVKVRNLEKQWIKKWLYQ